MVQANELRLGNWIYDDHGKPKQVVSISTNGVCVGKIQEIGWSVSMQAGPIPLTDEILAKTNLKIDQEYDGVYRIKGYHFHFQETELVTGINHEYGIGVAIKYLHEFQNWIFALTGEELQIEL
jgi:hypothetical protein